MCDIVLCRTQPPRTASAVFRPRRLPPHPVLTLAGSSAAQRLVSLTCLTFLAANCLTFEFVACPRAPVTLGDRSARSQRSRGLPGVRSVVTPTFFPPTASTFLCDRILRDTATVSAYKRGMSARIAPFTFALLGTLPERDAFRTLAGKNKRGSCNNLRRATLWSLVDSQPSHCLALLLHCAAVFFRTERALPILFGPAMKCDGIVFRVGGIDDAILLSFCVFLSGAHICQECGATTPFL